MPTETIVIENISDYRLKKAEKKLLSEPGIKFRDIDSLGTLRRNPRNVLLDILNRARINDTIYLDKRKNRGEYPQCDPGRKRSQGDLFKLMRYYYPNITFKEFRALLFDLINNKIIAISWCSTILKRVIIKPISGNKPFWNSPAIHGVTREIYSNHTGRITTVIIKDEFGFVLSTNTRNYEDRTRH